MTPALLPTGVLPRWAPVAAAALLTGCSHGLFSGVQHPERDTPVARIETRGGVEHGATTRAGILFLGRTAKEGPCRVHYLLGPNVLVEDGRIEALTDHLARARIDLTTQNAPVLLRPPTPDDELVAMYLDDGGVREVDVRLFHNEFVSGDALAWPGEKLPAGTPVFTWVADQPHFVGLVSALVTDPRAGSAGRFYTFAGLDRLREAWRVARPHPPVERVIHRRDGISTIK